MDAQEMVVGADIYQITFGPTFLSIDGFNSLSAIGWTLRIGSPIAVFVDSAEGAKHIDMLDKVLNGVESLVYCCGEKVSSFRLDTYCMELSFTNGTMLCTQWESQDVDCAQLDVTRTNSDGGKELIALLVFPGGE